MLTKQDFIEKIDEIIDKYPTIAPLYTAGDPRIRQNIEAIATVASMLSQQIEVAQSEMFEKTRESTIRADLSMRGFIPFARSAAATVEIKNLPQGASKEDILNSRFTYENGDIFYVTSVFNSPGEHKPCATLEQFERINAQYVVINDPKPMMRFKVEGLRNHLRELRVFVNTVSLNRSESGFYGIEKNELKYVLEYGTDGNYYVVLGDENAGYMPNQGDVLHIEAVVTNGYIPGLKRGSKFEPMENIGWRKDAEFVTISFQDDGKDPMNIEQMRMLSKYPSLYDRNAVYLGEFDHLLRQKFNINFISVWNESIQENALGKADIRNVNTLFVCLGQFFNEQDKWGGMTYIDKTVSTGAIETEPVVSGYQQLVHDTTTYAPMTAYTKIVHPSASFIDRYHIDTERIFKKADNSYRIKFIAPRLFRMTVHVECTVDSTQDRGVVSDRVRKTIANRYGLVRNGKPITLRPFFKPRRKEMYDLLAREVPEIVGSGDIHITFGNNEAKWDKFPDLIRYIDERCVTVTVNYASETNGGWS